MVLRYARIGCATAFDTNPIGTTGWFAAGYLLSWFGFAFAATDAQWALERAGLLTPMASASNVVGGMLLIMASLYQWSWFKDICLAHCQDTPLFIQAHGGFRRDVSGALKLGVWHGVWVLLGIDDVVVRRWRDEHVLDCGYCDACAGGENRQRTPRAAGSRRWSHRRRMVADAAYVLFRSLADIGRGPIRRSKKL
jgi:hypothetical protein